MAKFKVGDYVRVKPGSPKSGAPDTYLAPLSRSFGCKLRVKRVVEEERLTTYDVAGPGAFDTDAINEAYLEPWVEIEEKKNPGKWLVGEPYCGLSLLTADAPTSVTDATEIAKDYAVKNPGTTFQVLEVAAEYRVAPTPPAPMYKRGDQVVIVSDGLHDGPPHFLKIGSVATVDKSQDFHEQRLLIVGVGIENNPVRQSVNPRCVRPYTPPADLAGVK